MQWQKSNSGNDDAGSQSSKSLAGEPWKFNKTRQVWLLTNCYNLQKVPPKYFKIFIPYIKSLQGRAKKIASDEAVAIVENHDLAKLDDIE